MPTATKGLIFSIIHNALTNVNRHSQAKNVSVFLEFELLEFELGSIRLSVSDDGVGLPNGYTERREGFRNMLSSAEQMGAVRSNLQ